MWLQYNVIWFVIVCLKCIDQQWEYLNKKFWYPPKQQKCLVWILLWILVEKKMSRVLSGLVTTFVWWIMIFAQ